MSRIEIERESEGRLHRKVWRFDVMTGRYAGKSIIGLRPMWYAVQVRETTRHKYRTQAQWDSFDERGYVSSIKRADVPLPADVCRDAMAAVTVEILDING